ncbi:MAG: MFS transporter [Candidatus Marsarchaeota archaeon]|nr:MFS transporter [Candidatus Marsarchaeota archaeon]
MKQDPRAVYFLKGLYSFGYNSIAPILPVFLTTLTSSAAQIGMVPAAYQLSRTLGAFFFGQASDRMGHKRTLMAGIGLAIPLALLLLNAKTIGDYALIFFGIGISSGLFYISLDALATTLHAKKGQTLAGLEGAYHIGFLAGPFLGGFLAHQFGMPAVFVLCALMMLSTLALAGTLPPDRKKQPVSLGSAFSEMKLVLQQTPKSRLLAFASSTFVDGFGETSFWLLIPLYATSLGFNIVSVGTITAAAAAVTVLGVGHLGALSDRLGRRSSLLVSLGLMLSACLLLIWFHSFIAIALLAGVYALGRSAGYMNTRAFTADLASHSHRASALSVHELLFTAGRTIGPLAAGLMLDSAGAAFAFQAIALVIGANILLLWLLPEGMEANKKAGA